MRNERLAPERSYPEKSWTSKVSLHYQDFQKKTIDLRFLMGKRPSCRRLCLQMRFLSLISDAVIQFPKNDLAPNIAVLQSRLIDGNYWLCLTSHFEN